jgi:hypothetical protein
MNIYRWLIVACWLVLGAYWEVASLAHNGSSAGGRKMFGMSATDILADILRLPTEERARLAHDLIRSLDGEQDAGAAQAWDAAIEGRGAEVVRGVADTMTFEEPSRAHPAAPRRPRESLNLGIHRLAVA